MKSLYKLFLFLILFNLPIFSFADDDFDNNSDSMVTDPYSQNNINNSSLPQVEDPYSDRNSDRNPASSFDEE